jgi:hypothetical protein
MTSKAAQRFRVLMNIIEMVRALGLFYGVHIFMLTPKAYWTRFRAGRSLFSPTFFQPKDLLPAASISHRILPQEPYLRPTPHCNSHAPHIIALADKLRVRSGNDWQYAQAIYNFVRNDISFAYETLPRGGVVGTLKKGHGICVSKLHLLIALARAGGIPARYSVIGNVDLVEAKWYLSRIHSIDRILDTVKARSHKKSQSIIPGLKQMLKQLKNNVSVGIAPEFRWHPMAELKIGGYWIPADSTWADTEAAAFGLPLPRLGYDPVTMWGLTGSTISRSEALPLKRSFGIAWNLYCLLFRGANDNLNSVLEEVRAQGHEILEQTGRDEYIRGMQRYYIPVPGVAALNLALDQNA